jgi:hypothetical protein
MGIYTTGNQIRLGVVFKNQQGRPTNPTSVIVRVKNPNNVIVDYTGVQSAIGTFYYVATANIVGTWYYRWIGTGAVQAAAEQSFIITSAFV